MKSPSVMTIGLMIQGGGGWLGGALYVENLVRSLLALPPEEFACFRLVLFGDGAQLEKFKGLAGPECRLVNTGEMASVGFMDRQIYRWQRRVLGHKTPWFNRMMQREGVDFLYPYCPQDHKPKFFLSAAWMPDFQHAVMPEMFSPAEVQERDAAFRHVAAYAETIVVSSHAARENCRTYYPEALHKIQVLNFPSVIDPGIDPRAEMTAKTYNLPDRFFLLSNQFWRHKNHGLVLDALELLAKKGLYPCVACTGHTYDYRHPGYFDELLGEIHRRNLSGQMRILGVIPRTHQLRLMQTAIAVLQPSFFEGWNTTVEDARALDRPMLLSDIDVHREQAPPYSVYFNPTDPTALAEKMEMVWHQEKRLNGDEAVATLRVNQHKSVLKFARKFLEIANRRAIAR